MVNGISIAAGTRKLTAIAADSSYLENHLPISVPFSADRIGIGMANTQLPCKKLWTRSPPGAAESWLHATAIAPKKAAARQPKNVNGATGIGRPETMRATIAAQNGERLKIAAMMIGMRAGEADLVEHEPCHPQREDHAELSSTSRDRRGSRENRAGFAA